MKRTGLPFLLPFALALAASCSPGSVKEEVIARVPIDSPADLLTRSGVIIDPAITADGNGSARIETKEPITVRIAEVDATSIHSPRIIYRARLRAQDLQGKTYLEMWCAFPGQGEFFSRALQDPLSGTIEWTTQETVFVLESEQNPSRIRLNLVIDGAGTVWIDDVVLAAALH